MSLFSDIERHRRRDEREDPERAPATETRDPDDLALIREIEQIQRVRAVVDCRELAERETGFWVQLCRRRLARERGEL